MNLDVEPSECFKIGHEREKIIADILKDIYAENHSIIVYVLNNRYSLCNYTKRFVRYWEKFISGALSDEELFENVPISDNRPGGDKFYVYKDGITIVVRPKRKPLDILVFKNGKLWSAWEITNYRKTSYIRWNKFQHYIKNLRNLDCHRFFVISYFNNLKKAIDEKKSEEWNIEEAQKILAKNEIFLLVWEEQHMPLELKGWID